MAFVNVIVTRSIQHTDLVNRTVDLTQNFNEYQCLPSMSNIMLEGLSFRYARQFTVETNLKKNIRMAKSSEPNFQIGAS